MLSSRKFTNTWSTPKITLSNVKPDLIHFSIPPKPLSTKLSSSESPLKLMPESSNSLNKTKGSTGPYSKSKTALPESKPKSNKRSSSEFLLKSKTESTCLLLKINALKESSVSKETKPRNRMIHWLSNTASCTSEALFFWRKSTDSILWSVSWKASWKMLKTTFSRLKIVNNKWACQQKSKKRWCTWDKKTRSCTLKSTGFQCSSSNKSSSTSRKSAR